MNYLKNTLFTLILLSASLAHAQTKLDDISLNLPTEYNWEKGMSGYESDSLVRLQTWAVEKYNGETVVLVRVISSIKTGMREGVDEVKKMVAQTDKVTLLGEGKIEGQYPYVLFKGPTEGSALLMMYIETKTTLHIIKVVADKSKISEDFVKRWSTILKNPEITLGATIVAKINYLLPLDNQLFRISNFSEGLARIYYASDSVGFINTSGEKAFPQTFQDAGNFHSGRALVMNEVDGEKKYGFIDRNGKLVISCVYNTVGAFDGSRAVVKKGKQWLVIDRKGNVVFQNSALVLRKVPGCFFGPHTDEVIPPEFHEGLIKIIKKGKIGYIDTAGRVVIPPQFKAASVFSGGVALVKTDQQGLAVINKKGGILSRFPPQVVSVGLPSPEGICRFRSEKGKYGFMDRRGKIIVPDTLNYAPEPFHEGVAILWPNKRYEKDHSLTFMIIDTTGEIRSTVTLENHQSAMPVRQSVFHEGLLPVEENGKWGYINKSGELIIPFQFMSAGGFYNGRAKVMALNWRANYIVNPLKKREK